MTVTYGPQYVAHAEADAPHTSAATDARRTAPIAHLPLRWVSVDQPGVVGNRSAGDGGGSRHGDAQAVSVDQRALLLLVPGAAAPVEADDIQDRHGDIPVSPA